ncbi:acetyltransferase [Polyplosphaeria fusca]|uniref:Acetyltransferase n=1 Tax=Polyplosphaeria fusca TaxID=682080 RepID=A0A9P4QR42_9PLEO|nr:acetyltransferase [Polyplosphaeria fusca]
MDTKEWRRTLNGQTFLISTSRSLLSHAFVQQAFGTQAMYWAKPTSDANMKTLLDNSCTLGLYKTEDGEATKTPIGLGRVITDYVTFAFLTDVYIVDESRRLGLGRWLINCCKELFLDMADLRFVLLLTGSESAQAMYEDELAMDVLGKSESGPTVMGVRKAKLQDQRVKSGLAGA